MYWLGRPGQLSLENQPVVEAVSPNRRASSNIDPPRLTVRDRRGRITRSLDGELLTMESIIGADSAFLRGEPRVHDGLVEATSIDLWLPENFDSVAVRFRVGALRSAPVVVNRGWSHFSLRLASGSLAGQVVASPNPTIHVARGSPIEGQLVFRYITPSRAATYMLGESSTFNDYRTDTTTLISLLPGALNAAVTVRVSRTAPLVAGTYWLAWALAAETNAQSIWSSTNWACGPGVWDDGNDILANPDALRRLPDWSGGQLNISKLSCPEGLPPKFGSDRLRIAAVQVIVDP